MLGAELQREQSHVVLLAFSVQHEQDLVSAVVGEHFIGLLTDRQLVNLLEVLLLPTSVGNDFNEVQFAKKFFLLVFGKPRRLLSLNHQEASLQLRRLHFHVRV